MKILPWFLPVILLAALLSNGCKKDVLNTDGALTFSSDTVLFDTIFTTIGSATMRFRIHNPSKDEINISSIRLARGQQSKYRINVDGTAGISFSNISIPGRDSLFVFVDVTLDPNNQLGTILVTDSILFTTNGIQQDVDLVACGWDADFHYPTDFIPGIGSISWLECNTIWTSERPHVIYGWAVVPEGCTLTIEADARVFSHANSGIIVDEGGTLIVSGTTELPVIFASDRLDDFYEDQAGEWNWIWLFNGSLNNVIDNAIIKNGNIGIRVDTFSIASINPTLRLSNTVIENMAAVSLLSYTGTVDAYNCVFGNSGQYSAAFVAGGTYNFRHCTFANYWANGNRQTPAVLLSNRLETATNYYVEPLNAYFGNCIVTGNNSTELGLDEDPAATFNFKFDNCLMRVATETIGNEEPLDISDPNQFKEITYNQDGIFINPSEQNFELDTLSAAKDIGAISIVNAFSELQFDLLGNSRFDQPDLGAYERQE